MGFPERTSIDGISPEKLDSRGVAGDDRYFENAAESMRRRGLIAGAAYTCPLAWVVFTTCASGDPVIVRQFKAWDTNNAQPGATVVREDVGIYSVTWEPVALDSSIAVAENVERPITLRGVGAFVQYTSDVWGYLSQRLVSSNTARISHSSDGSVGDDREPGAGFFDILAVFW